MGINGCQSPLNYKYQDGTCNSSCPAPYIIGISLFGGRQCFLPCPTGQYVLDNGICMATCPNYYIVREDGYCSNPCSSSGEYFYRNGSCLSICPKGFVFKYQSPNFFCTNPCNSGQYLYENGSCLATCRSNFISNVYGEEMLCDFPCQYGSGDNYLYPNGTCGEPCQGDFVGGGPSTYPECDLNPYAVNKCPNGFLYQDGSCRKSCPSPYIALLLAGATKLCNLPCPLGKYYYSPNDTCVSGCEIQFRTVKNDILSCDGGAYNYTEEPSATNSSSYTAILEIYIRYNIALNDFYNQNGLIKFLKLLAELFGIDISQITISDIREGSTIIETKVAVTSDSDSKSKASANSQIKTMSEKFENAAKAKNLNLAGIKVLNYRSSMVIPDQDQIKIEESSSKAVAIGVAVGASLAVIAVGLTIYSVYRRKQKLRMRRVAKTEVQVNPVPDQQVKNNDQSKDEEFDGLAQISIFQIKENTLEKTQNRIAPFESARKDFESNQPGPLEKIEEASDCKEDTLKSNRSQVIGQLKEKEDQKAMSINEIMKKIDAGTNVENQIELNFEY